MIAELDRLCGSCLFEINQCKDLKKLEEIRVAVFGKNGKLTEKFKCLKNLAPDERKSFGAKINEVKNQITNRMNEKLAALEVQELEKKLERERVDVSMPVDSKPYGYIHPITKVFSEISTILNGHGFQFFEGPDIESEYFNFDTMNMPEYHPARTMHDTFYLNVPADGHGRRLLRTHTSPVETRFMLENKPPMRFFTIGRTFRSDYDATHTPMFDQVEMLAVEKNIGMAQLKWLIKDVLKKFFNLKDISIRFRPSFFPFTEPSAEVDINYKIVNAVGVDFFYAIHIGISTER